MLKYLGILLFFLTICLDASFAKSKDEAKQIKQDAKKESGKTSKKNSKNNVKTEVSKAKNPKNAKKDGTKDIAKKTSSGNVKKNKAKSKSKSKQKKPPEPVLVSKIPTYLDETPESLKEKPSTLETHMQKLRTTLALECEMLDYEVKNLEESKSFEDKVLADVAAKNPELVFQQDKPATLTTLQDQENNIPQTKSKDDTGNNKDNVAEEPKVKKKLILQPL